MDPIVGTGSASMMAIRVLLDHDYQEENIILVSLLMAECGAQGMRKNFKYFQIWKNINFNSRGAISYAFPRVKIITAAIDKEYDFDTRQIIPGLGNFGNRYFGTC